MKFCPECGKQLEGSAGFCGKCGTPLSVSQDKSIDIGDGTTKGGQNNIKTALVVGAVIAFVAIAVFGFQSIFVSPLVGTWESADGSGDTMIFTNDGTWILNGEVVGTNFEFRDGWIVADDPECESYGQEFIESGMSVSWVSIEAEINGDILYLGESRSVFTRSR